MRRNRYVNNDFMEFITLASISFAMILAVLYIAY